MLYHVRGVGSGGVNFHHIFGHILPLGACSRRSTLPQFQVPFFLSFRYFLGTIISSKHL